MIIITTSNGFEHNYNGNITIAHDDNMLQIIWSNSKGYEHEDGEWYTWYNNGVDWFDLKDIKSIEGVYEN